ncbi:MAG: hypothetical protein AMJ46_11560 [Latescibacteria bacterium DG_63]|nr:MAG: hypothetical protein AMJ46_11560 [Latescibacteria bacterium DG_63]
MNHLSDEDIQAYLEGEAVAKKARVENHLRECPACRRVFEEYRNLYDALADEECFAPAMDLAEQTLRKLRIAEKDKPLREYLDTVVGALGITIALAVAAWAYVGLGGPRPDFGDVFNAFAYYFSLAIEALASLKTPVASLRVEMRFAVMAGFVIYIILSLDYLFLAFPIRQKAIR